jgi:hypothetical protein
MDHLSLIVGNQVVSGVAMGLQKRGGAMALSSIESCPATTWQRFSGFIVERRIATPSLARIGN